MGKAYISGKIPGGSGVTDYSQLANKPQINGVELTTTSTSKSLSLGSQFAVLPSPGVDYAGYVVQYMGDTTSEYIHGYFYECDIDDETQVYRWKQINVQNGSGVIGESGVQVVDNVASIKLQAEANGLVVDTSGLSLNLATSDSSGAMSSSDKSKLDGLRNVTKLSELENDESFVSQTWVEDKHYLVADDIKDKANVSDLNAHVNNEEIHVTAEQKSAWDNKSDFSGSYNDLTDKPSIPEVPTKVSAFENDAGYLTEHQSLDAYRTSEDQDVIDSKKQDKLTAGNNISINDNNVISADIDLSQYAKLIDLQIGKSFVTDVTVGNLESGTQINSTDTLGDILYNILYKDQPTGDILLYVGATTNPPVDLTGLTQISGKSASDLITNGLTRVIPVEIDPETEMGQYPVIAVGKDVSLVRWVATEFPMGPLSYGVVDKGNYKLYYLVGSTLQDISYAFTFEEA